MQGKKKKLKARKAKGRKARQKKIRDEIKRLTLVTEGDTVTGIEGDFKEQLAVPRTSQTTSSDILDIVQVTTSGVVTLKKRKPEKSRSERAKKKSKRQKARSKARQKKR